MTTEEYNKEQKKKIIEGLAIAYEKMLEFKRYKNSYLVVCREGKIVWLKP
jgi:hypothetical protein